MPILMQCSKELDTVVDSTLYLVADFGSYLKYINIFISEEYSQTMNLYDRWYDKSNFPEEYIIDAFWGLTFKNGEKTDYGVLLQFETWLLKWFYSAHGSVEKINLSFEKGEIIYNSEINGLLLWK